MADQLAVLDDSYLTERRSLCAVKEEGSASGYDKRSFVFFNFKKDPIENKGRENVSLHPYEASRIGCLYRCKEEGQGSADKGSFFFQNLRKGGLFFKI